MSFVANNSQQIALNDALSSLTARERRMLEKSWAKEFAEHIFPLIDEEPFSALYSDKASRPNTPVNVILGALMIKELLDLTDDEILEAMMFDIRFQYALHTTSFEEQPLSDRSLSRFRNRCYTYEVATGKDLIHDCITHLSGAMARLMKIHAGLWRTDSLMVASNIKKLSRLELMYTCVANLVCYLHKHKQDDKVGGMEHYYDPSDYNRIIYHNRNAETDERLKTILDDAVRLLAACNGRYDEVSEYQLLLRAVQEQTILNEDGTRRMKTKEDGLMGPHILQNPSDPDATYREKGSKQHRGYIANVVECVGEEGSVITDYQYDQNTHSDSQFLKEIVEAMGPQGKEATIIADGAYSGADNVVTAKEYNIRLITTDLTGRETKEIFADFRFSEDGGEVLSCAAGNNPKSCSKPNGNGHCRVSFSRDLCESCPHKEECQPKMLNKTAVLHLSEKSVARATAQRQMNTEEFKQMQKLRNGVESIPSILRRKYGVDHMPVRGKIRTRLWFGFKIAALNAKKLFNFLSTLGQCAQIAVMV